MNWFDDTSWYNAWLATLTSMGKVPEAWTVSIPRAVGSKLTHLVCLAQGICIARASLQTV